MADLVNLARHSTTTTGTGGPISLGPVVTGFISFADAGAVDGRTYTYGIEDGDQREIGRGVYSAAGQTITRSVLVSTNSNTPINLSGTAQVLCTPAAEDFIQKALDLAFAPAGNLVATNVQAAIEELDTEKEAAGTAASAVTAHEAANDPHSQYRNAVYDVRLYGAVLDGTTDDTQALVDAAAALRAAGGGTLWFPPGSKCKVSYHPHVGFTADGERTVLLFTEPGIKVRVQGNDTEIIFDAADRTTYANFIYVSGTGKTSRIEVDGFRYRYLKPHFITGVVTAFTAGVSINIDVDYAPTFGDVQRMHRFVNKLVDPNAVIAYSTTWTAGNPITLVSGVNWQIDISTRTTDVSNLAIGDEVLLDHHVFTNHFLRVQDGGDVVARDNEINHTAGSPFRILGAEHVTISGNRVIALSDLRVKRTTPSDGCHVSNAKLVVVKGNTFEWTGDDAINVTSKATNVTARVSNTQVTCGRRWPPTLPIVGHTVQFVDANRLNLYEARVVSVDAASATEFTITVTGTLPAALDNTWECISLVEDAQITDNVTLYTRGRGVFATARNLTVSVNKVIGSTGSAILIPSNAAAHTAVKSAVIAGNDVDRCNNPVIGLGSPAAIYVEAFLVDTVTRMTGIAYENVAIISNSISNTGNGGVIVYSAKDLEIAWNRMANIALNPYAFDGFLSGKPIAFRYCDNVGVVGNVLSGLTPRTAEAQNSTNINWSDNQNILHSVGTNPIRYLSRSNQWEVLASGGGLSHTGNTTATVLALHTVLGGSIGPNGLLRISTLWSYTNSANTKTLRVTFGSGGTLLFNVAPTAATTTRDIDRILMNRNSQASQVFLNAGLLTVGSFNGFLPTIGTINTAIDQDLSFIAILANAAETITLEQYLVELFYRP